MPEEEHTWEINTKRRKKTTQFLPARPLNQKCNESSTNIKKVCVCVCERERERERERGERERERERREREERESKGTRLCVKKKHLSEFLQH